MTVPGRGRRLAGLRHLEEAARTAARAGVGFVLGGRPQPLVARVLTLTGTELGPRPRRSVPAGTRRGAGQRLPSVQERLLRLSMLAVAGSTVLASVLLATFAGPG
ncbi:hypothetical protein ACWDR0_08105 [Streptomyces sp. NPDC003691]